MKVLGVKDSVVQSLRTQIIIGELTPGQKLNELVLSSLLGISRPPLREAFRLLENEHLAHSIPRKGTLCQQPIGSGSERGFSGQSDDRMLRH